MTLIGNLESAAEKVFHDVEAGVAKADGQALAEARRLLDDAKAAENGLAALLGNYRAEIRALLAKYGPEVVADVDAELGKLLSQVKALFGIAGA